MLLDGLNDWLRAARGVFGTRRRRWATCGPRLHVEVRIEQPGDAATLASRLDDLAQGEPGIAWVDVIPVLRRTVLAFDPVAIDPERLVALVERAEAACGFGGRPFHTVPEHPADLEPLVRLVAELGADVAGFWLAVAGRIAALRVLPVEIDLLAIASVLEGMPTLRQWVDTRIGPQTSSLWLGIASALAQGLTQNPLGPLVDVTYRSCQAVERLARRRVWLEREPDLCAAPGGMPSPLPQPDARPTALPPGPIERYAELAFVGSLGAFGLGVVTTGSFADSSAILVGGVPKPARLGREAFAALLAQALAARGIVALDPAVLRRLDRVDCLAVPAAFSEHPEYDALAAAARQAGLAVETIARNGDPVRVVRELQRDGRVVLLVTDAPGGALAAADAAVGLAMPEAAPPWDAHLLAGPSLDDARLVVLACAAARRVAAESVTLAEVGVGLGLLAAFGRGLGWTTTSRVMMATHVATLLSMANGARHAWTLALAPRPAARDDTPWHALDADEALVRLRSRAEGLTTQEAGRRAEAPAEPPTFAARLARAVGAELTNPLAPILAVGAGLSAAIGAVTDAALVGTVMLADAAIGALERLRAEDAIADLRADRPRSVRVLRDGHEVTIAATALVAGDVVRLEAGDLVPADCRILEALGLEADESALTGESLPVLKHAAPIDAEEIADRGSILYEGTAIAAGGATAVVFAVGAATESQRAGATAEEGTVVTGVEARLASLVRVAGPVAVGSGALTAAAGLLRGRPLREVLSTAVSLAVAAVPEGLPMLATVAQLAAARRLSGRGVLVRNARAIEALGRAQLVCLDKTGTLTEGRIALRCVSDGPCEEAPAALGPQGREILRVALRATPMAEAGQRLPHGTDRALLEGAARAGLDGREGADGWLPIAELPFASERGYHAVLGRTGDGLRLCVKGAPEVVLPRCAWRAEAAGPRTLDPETAERMEVEARRLARRGLRVLAVAEASVATNGGLGDEQVRDLVVRGFVGLADPVRASAVRAVEGLRQAGVRLVMMTGDHPSTAESIGAELGLLDGGGTLTGATIDQLDDEALARAARDTTVFARVAPRHKARLVDALERAGLVVAMTGDGANDAPAIRRASVGIAVGRRCTTAARNAADLVVTDDRIETLVDAVLEGRAMWASVRDAVSVLLGGNLGEVVFTLGTGLVSGTPALNARQLLLVNLLTDTAPALAIALRPPPAITPEALLREGPEASLGIPLARDVVWRGLVTAGGTGGAWLAARAVARRPRADTVALVALVGTQIGQTLAIGGRSPVVVGASLASFGALAAVVQTPGLSHFFGCRPLGPVGWTIAGGASVLATGASVLVPRLLPALDPWIERLAVWAEWPATLPIGASLATAPEMQRGSAR
jgi:cation-transporting P-type ATPase I